MDINEYQACLGTKHLEGVSCQTDHQTGTSAPAPKHPRSRKLSRLLTVALQYRNPIESSKLEATADGSIAFIVANLQRST
ncbi:hypothetical protein TNCV_1691481 [Trichonephila clavipes]|nr:hypothetical protein TNCV_1691481 [Trichonephila clavipes]